MVNSVGVVLTIAYPVAVFFALTHFSARMVGLLGLCFAVPLLALKFRSADREHLMAVLRVPLVVIALLALSAILDDARFVMALPVLISVALLITFAGSLRGEMPIVERFARMQEARRVRRNGARSSPGGVAARSAAGDPAVEKEKSLSEAQVRHCRQVTIAWCVFFVINAGIAAALALLELKMEWAIYTGGIAYGLMGLMFAGEYALRIHRFGVAR